MWYNFRSKITYSHGEIRIEYCEEYCKDRDALWKYKNWLKGYYGEVENVVSVEVTETELKSGKKLIDFDWGI